MKKHPISGLILAACLLAGIPLRAQPDTDIFLTELSKAAGSWQAGPAKNLSANPGYDNQPSFWSDHLLLYSGTRRGQTDIACLDLDSGQTTWLSDTPGGGEYSPLKIPGSEAVSAIRLDTTGLQRLYAYPLDGKPPTVLLDSLKVGYHIWAGPDRIVCTVLVGAGMDLVVAHPGDGSVYTFQKGVGRSLQQIPGSTQISYTAAEAKGLAVRAMDPVSGATRLLAVLPEGVQDYCWLPDGSLLAGSDNRLLRLETGSPWEVFHEFPGDQLGNITRLSISPDGSRLALAAEPR